MAEDKERHARGFLDETSWSEKAKMTISEFCEQRFLPYHAITPSTRQEYGYTAKNHIIPYIGHLRISEVNRETFFNLLVKVLPAEEASQVTVRAKPGRTPVLTRLYPDALGPFEHLFFCWRLTANKPDPAVYRQVTDLLAVPPGQIGFADDSAGNVEAALACGWNAVRYRSPGDLGALTG